MALIPNIVNKVIANPSPVLFLDACVLLDIVRAPMRSKEAEVESARVFLSSAQKSPCTVHLLIASPIQTEWNTHIQEAVNLCTTAVNAYNSVAVICGHLGLPPIPALPASVLTMPALLRQLSVDLLASCDIINHDFDAMDQAINRIISNTHPVKQPHSKGAKDAVIVEHALRTTAELRNSGFAGQCLLISSNTSDFAQRNSNILHHEFTVAFNAVNLQYAASLASGEAELRNAGWIS